MGRKGRHLKFLLFSFNFIFGYNLYYGNLHSHTSYSDGRGLPRHAFAYAKDTARIHILAITDHGEWLEDWEWEDIKRQADSATIPNQFLGLAGFEWTSLDGHITVFNTLDYTDANRTPSVSGLYEWLAGRNQAIGQFNHPGGPYLFNRFRHNSLGDISMTLFEMQNRNHGDVYHIALDSGWKVGITANQDNHFPNWGSGNQLTGIWAESLTKSSILSAIHEMRTFGTLDRNFQLVFKANNSWMGSTIPNGEIRFEIQGIDPDPGDFIRRIDMITNNNLILDSLLLGNTNSCHWVKIIRTNPGEKRYFFIRVQQIDSDYVISSPIWVRDGGGIWEREEYKILPNPFRSTITFTFNLNCLRDLIGVKIYNVAGRLIKKFPPQSRIHWEGRDEMGNEMPSGLYFLVLERGRARISRKILRL